MTHRNLTSTSLNDISDKPEKDQVSFRFRLHLVMCVVRSQVLGKETLYWKAEEGEVEQGESSISESTDWILHLWSISPWNKEVKLLQSLKQVAPHTEAVWHPADIHEKGMDDLQILMSVWSSSCWKEGLQGFQQGSHVTQHSSYGHTAFRHAFTWDTGQIRSV